MRNARGLVFVLTAVTAGWVTPTAVAQKSFVLTSGAVDQAVTLIYDPADGSAALTAPGLSGLTTTTLESVNSLFNPDAFDGEITGFDQNDASIFFKLTAVPNVSHGFEFGAGWLPAGMSEDDLVAELKWFGSLAPAGSWEDAAGGGPYFTTVPEPTSWACLACGAVALHALIRRSSKAPRSS